MGKISLRLSTINLSHEVTTREKAFFVLILVATLILFLDVFWKPRAGSINLLNAELLRLEQQQDAVQKLITATKDQIVKKQDEPSKSLETDSYVKKVLNRQVVDQTEEINSTADMMGNRSFAKRAHIKKVEIGERKEEKDHTAVSIAVSLDGRYPAIRDYMSALENIGRPLIVESMTLKKEAKNSPVLNSEIQTKLFIPKL